MRPVVLLLWMVVLPGVRAQTAVVLHHWSGGLLAREIRVNALLSDPCDSVRLVVDDDPGFSSPVYSAYMPADTAQGLVAHLHRGGLQPSTHYHYRFEVAGRVDTTAANSGRFRTPGEGATSFSFAVGSCNSSDDHPVWQSMRWLQPDLFIASGDLHYADPVGTDPDVHRTAYLQHVYQHTPVMEFLHDVPLAYVWDDHDFCGNGSDAQAPGRSAAGRAYRDHVPHYVLADSVAIHQAFTIGRVHFILSDMRATRTPEHMMDSAQHAWLRSELLHARDSGLIACWVTGLTWNAIDYPENWGSQPAEREALGNWLLANQIKDLFILSGDAHMLAIDDGANADFSTGQQSPYRYPVFQAAALNRGGSYKGGTFNQGGVHPNPGAWIGQFGQVRVEDDGGDVCITFNGWRTDSMSAAISLVNTYTFCRQLPAVGMPGAEPSAGRAWWQGATVHIILPNGARAEEVEVLDALGRAHCRTAVASADGIFNVTCPDRPTGALLVRVRCGPRIITLKTYAP